MTTLENIYLTLSLLLVIASGVCLERSFGRSIVLSFIGGLVSLVILSEEILKFAQLIMAKMPQGPVGLQFLTAAVLVILSLAIGFGILTGLGLFLGVVYRKTKMTAFRIKR